MKLIESSRQHLRRLWAHRRQWLVVMACLLPFTSCLDDDSLEQDDDYVGNFEAVWTALDEHYCYFDQKGVDWDEVYARYYPLVRDSVSNPVQLFNLLDCMLDELRDGHTNLYTPFNVARYWAWNEQYPPNFDENLLERYYLGTNYWIASSLRFGVFAADTVAYIRYSSFASAVGETNLDYALAALGYAKGLIIDIRDNGGGSLTNVPLIANRFATEKTLYGYMKHKTGKGHNDFSKPEALYLEPQAGRIDWDASVRPVVVLTNRSTFSAANNFVAAMRSLSGTLTTDSLGRRYPKLISIIGDRTGGGGGMPFETVLPNGWTLRFSACPLLDHRERDTEEGIDPDYRVDMDSVHAFRDHIDDIIEAARLYINKNTRVRYRKEVRPK